MTNTKDPIEQKAREWRLENIPMMYAAPMASGAAGTFMPGEQTTTMITLEPSWTDERVAEFARGLLEEACKLVCEECRVKVFKLDSVGHDHFHCTCSGAFYKRCDA